MNDLGVEISIRLDKQILCDEEGNFLMHQAYFVGSCFVFIGRPHGKSCREVNAHHASRHSGKS